MPPATTTARRPLRAPGDRDRRRAWVSLGLLPVGLVLAMVVGEGLLSAQGYGPDDDVPMGAVLLAGVPALLVLLASPAGAIWFGLRSSRAGGTHDPVNAGLAVAAVLLVLNVVPFLLGR